MAVNAEERRVARPGIWWCNTPRFETSKADAEGVAGSNGTADTNGAVATKGWAATNGVAITKGLVVWKVGVMVVLLGVALWSN